MIQVHQLVKSYDDPTRGRLVAVDNVTFQVHGGEIFGLLGPNGAGKTTILRILSTVLRPTAGVARVNGSDVSRQPDLVRRHIGFVSANTAVYDRMTAGETVTYFGQLHGVPAELLKDRSARIFQRLQLLESRDLLCSKMSTGMKQKVSIARALIHDPPVLILDEATLGLDVLVARSLREVIEELRDQGKCILLSTHLMRDAERLCDRLAVMHQGRFLASGSQEQLRDACGTCDLEEVFFRLISAEQPVAA
jgi:sodium transport system ATP-binding protein